MAIPVWFGRLRFGLFVVVVLLLMLRLLIDIPINSVVVLRFLVLCLGFLVWLCVLCCFSVCLIVICCFCFICLFMLVIFLWFCAGCVYGLLVGLGL